MLLSKEKSKNKFVRGNKMGICYSCGGSGKVDSMYGNFKRVCSRCHGTGIYPPHKKDISNYERHPLLKEKFWKVFKISIKSSLNFHPSMSDNGHERFIQALIKYNKTVENIISIRKKLSSTLEFDIKKINDFKKPIITKVDIYNFFESTVCVNVITVENILVYLNNVFLKITHILIKENVLNYIAVKIESLTENIINASNKLTTDFERYKQSSSLHNPSLLKNSYEKFTQAAKKYKNTLNDIVLVRKKLSHILEFNIKNFNNLKTPIITKKDNVYNILECIVCANVFIAETLVDEFLKKIDEFSKENLLYNIAENIESLTENIINAYDKYPSDQNQYHSYILY